MSPMSSPSSADARHGSATGRAAGGATSGRGRSRTPDRICAEAVELAREAAEEAAHPHPLGTYLGAEAEGDRLVTHFFACEDPGYPGWRWGVTVTRAARARHVTIAEVALTPGPDALLAPEWVPWSERLRPGDLRPGDLLPTEYDDPRLEPGVVEAAGEAGDAGEAHDVAAGHAEPGPGRGTIAEVAEQLGLGRRRVLSWHGLHEAAERWAERFGPETPMAQSAPATCVSCGFLVPLAGSLRQSFGVCANEYSPADGCVVSLSYGCGAHSEAAGAPKPEPPAPPVLDNMGADPL